MKWFVGCILDIIEVPRRRVCVRDLSVASVIQHHSANVPVSNFFKIDVLQSHPAGDSIDFASMWAYAQRVMCPQIWAKVPRLDKPEEALLDRLSL